MGNFVDNKSIFRFQYLPDYAKFLLENKVEEFVTVGIRFARELDLPMMKPLAKIPEKELIALSMESTREILKALAENAVDKFIDKNIRRYVNNEMVNAKGEMLLDKTDVVAEDIILAFYIRRKVFSFFLYAYTQNAVLHLLIANEVDMYTTHEHLLTTKAYIASLKEESVSRRTAQGS